MKYLVFALALLLTPLSAVAANCPGYSYILTNGQVADANQVMANFNTIMNCANTNLVGNSQITGFAPLNAPSFTGGITVTGGIFTDSILASGAITSTTGFTISASAGAIMTLGSPAGNNRGLSMVTGPNQRWQVLADAAPEGGGNAGTNFSIFRYTDAGAIVDSPLNINRATGVVNLGDGANLGANSSLTLTPAPGDNSTKIATTAFVTNAIGALPLASTSTAGISFLATAAQVVAGTNTSNTITPAAFAAAQNLAGPGYVELPGGLFIEWGGGNSIAPNGSAALTFNHACASQIFSITVTPSSNPGSGGMSYAYVSAPSLTGFTLNNGAPAVTSFYWTAICK